MWEWPLVESDQKFMAWIRDIAPPPRSGFQTLLHITRWAVERRRNRGRDGGPGPCGRQCGEDGTGAHQGRADRTEAPQGGADGPGAHQGRADGTVTLLGGAEGTGAHQGRADRTVNPRTEQMDLEPPRAEQTEPGTTRAGQTGQISLTAPAHIGEQRPTTQGEQRQTTLGEQRQTTQGEPSWSQGPWQSRSGTHRRPL